MRKNVEKLRCGSGGIYTGTRSKKTTGYPVYRKRNRISGRSLLLT